MKRGPAIAVEPSVWLDLERICDPRKARRVDSNSHQSSDGSVRNDSKESRQGETQTRGSDLRHRLNLERLRGARQTRNSDDRCDALAVHTMLAESRGRETVMNAADRNDARRLSRKTAKVKFFLQVASKGLALSPS